MKRNLYNVTTWVLSNTARIRLMLMILIVVLMMIAAAAPTTVTFADNVPPAIGH